MMIETVVYIGWNGSKKNFQFKKAKEHAAYPFGPTGLVVCTRALTAGGLEKLLTQVS